MDTPESKQILAPEGPIARRLEHYEERPQQQDMVAEVEASLEKRRHLLLEAGTGVGKSFGYLIPMMRHAATTGERVIISTKTIALQDQLDQKDLPLLSAVLPYEIPVVVAKGRGNYLCHRRLHRAILHATSLFDDATAKTQLKELKEWSTRTNDGTRSDLHYQPEPAVWEQVAAEAGNCSQRRCPHYDNCFYQRARRRMETARIIVVNHALYFSDLALRMAGALYLPDHTVVVFDEAHMVDTVATKQLGTELGPGRIDYLLSRLHSRRTGRGLLGTVKDPLAIIGVQEVRTATVDFFKEVNAWQEKHDPEGQGKLLDDLPFVPNTISGPLSALSSALLTAAEGDNVDEDNRMELSHYALKTAALAKSASILLDERPKNFVIWTAGKGRKVKIVGAPLKVGEILAQHLFPAKRTCLLTSATLTTGKSKGFDYIKERLGLPSCDQVSLGSPFPYDRNVEIHLHRDLPPPSTGANWENAVMDQIKKQVRTEGGRSLVLFTSWKLVDKARGMATELGDEGIPCIFQNEGPVQRLVERKRRCDEAVLFGTESLWEGIDIPGDALTLVIIPRLPFPVPTNPLVKARSRELEKKGKSSFWEYHLPEAILRFKQGFGRLVRRNDDRGRVVILDSRLLAKPYGRRFIRALPPCPIVVHHGQGEPQRIELEEM